MAEELFSRFPMLDAAIVNAVAESFASSSGQVDVLQASRALEKMLPADYRYQTGSSRELPEAISVVDPMQSFSSAPTDQLQTGALILGF